MSIDHCDVMLGALSSGIQHCNVQFGKTYNLAILEQSNKNANVTWGTAPNYWTATETGNDWARAQWKFTPLDSRGTGNVRVTVHADSGSVPIMKIMAGTWNDPDLSGNTSSPYGTIYGGNTYVFPGDGNRTYQTSYFNMTVGWAGPYSISSHITKIEWQVGATGYRTVWEENAAGAIKHCDVRFG